MKTNTRTMTMGALGTAVLCVLSQFSIPMPSGMPLTLQTLAVALCGFLLGAKGGALCTLTYLLLGAVGLPVFSGFSGGLARLTGVTGGFLAGFIPMAALCGAGAGSGWRGAIWASAGLLLCHLLGTLQFSLVSGVGLWQAALAASIPYLIKDALSICAAWALSATILRRVRRAA